MCNYFKSLKGVKAVRHSNTRYRRKKAYRYGEFNNKYIYVTNHAIERYKQRFKNMSRENVQRAIKENVKRSRLIALTKFGGREIRENRGILFVCELNGCKMNVITVLISEVDLRFVC